MGAWVTVSESWYQYQSDLDAEVALDIPVTGGVAPCGIITVYFAPSTSQGFVAAIRQAVHVRVSKPSVNSNS